MISKATELRNPYPGLRPFEAEDAEYFFGRDRQVDQLLLALRDHRFVAVLGLSGSGKSSLVRAGLVPALKVGHLTSSGSRWRVALFRPGLQPLEALAAALDESLGADSGRLDSLRTSTNSLLLSTCTGRGPEESLLVVVDQFEEIFRVSNIREATHFIDLLLAAEQDVSPSFRLYVVLTMRTDRLGECSRFEGLPEALNRSQYLVPRLASDQLREAIEGPAALTDTAISPELAQKLAIEASEGRDQLPLLQHLLMTLWELRKTAADGSSLISLAEYETTKSAADALNDDADRVLDELSIKRRHLAGLIFRALTEAGEGRDQRCPQRLSNLAEITGAAPEEVLAIVEHFRAASFLSSPDRGRTPDWEVDITHESLIRQWKNLAKWVAEEIKNAGDYRYFSERTHRGADSLAGLDLDLALQWLEKGHNSFWAARYGGNFDDTIRYIHRSLEAREAGRQRAYVLAATFLLIAVAIGLLSLYAWRTSIRAQTALARSAVQDGVKLFDEGRPDQAAGYFAHALRIAPDSLAATSWLSDLLLNKDWWIPGAPLQHQGSVYSAAFSPDGRLVVTASDDKTARVWEADTGKPAGAPLQHQQTVNSAAFSPDGRRVVTVSDNTARVCGADTGKPVGAPLQHQRPVNSAAFSPDGRRVVTASDDNTARVWEADTGKPVGAPLRHQGAVRSAAFSPDGRRVVTASEDKIARVWEANTGKPVDALLQHQGRVYSAAFSPDGRRVVTASDDKTARVWEADTGKPVGAPLQHQGMVLSAAFSSDGRRVVTASADNTARVWEADTGKPVGAPLQHHGTVLSAAFSPDGRWVMTTSADKTARVWAVLLACCASQHEANRLASLAEAVSRNEVSDTGSLTVIEGAEKLRKLGQQNGAGLPRDLSLDWIIRRFAPAK